MLVAVALGGVWFIPSAWSYALALGGAAVCALLGLGLAPRFERLGLPLWILPFNLTVPLVLQPGLEPEDDPAAVARGLRSATRSVAIIGHEPPGTPAVPTPAHRRPWTS